MATSSISKTINLATKEEVQKFVEAVESSMKNKDNYTCYTATYREPCEHQTGWYGTVKTFWSKILGLNGIVIYCCSICGKILQGKKLKEFQKNK